MIVGGNSSPYRERCEPWARGRRTCFQHKIKSHTAIEVWESVTRVADYNTDGGGEPIEPDGIPPYPKPFTPRPDLGDCPGNPDCPDDPPAPSNTLPKCGEWTDIEKPVPVEDASHHTIDGNVYEQTESTVDLSECRKIGFKNVQARKVWHGRFGWMSSDPIGAGNNINCGDCSATYEPERATADQTKYLTIDATATVSVSTTGGAIAHEKLTVDSVSGVKGQEECSYAQDEGASAQMTAAIALLGSADDAGHQLLAAAWGRELDRVVPHPELYDTTIVCDGPQKMTATAIKIADSSTALEGEVDYAAGTLSITVTNVNGSNTSVTMTITNSTVWYSREDVFNPGAGPDEITTTESLEAELSNPYTAANVNDEVDQLLSYWDMTDDAVYPWRTDEHTNIAPLISRDEVQSPVLPSIVGECDWTDPNGSIVTGEVRGAPLSAGYGPHFDWKHKTWYICNGTAIYQHSTGAWSGQTNEGDTTDAVVPKTATQWTENLGTIVDNFPIKFPRHGAWRDFRNGILYTQKWAEVKVWRPSQNFARPCGLDRFLPDQNAVRCVIDFDGTNVTLDPTPSDPSYSSDDLVVLAGTSFDGLYPIVSGSGGSYTVGAKIQDLPADFPHYGAIIGKVRFPECPAIGGRVAVISATQSGGNVNIEIAGIRTKSGEAYLRSGDKVDFTDVAGLGSGLTATLTSPTTFSVAGVLSVPYTGGGYVSSNAAPSYEWYDTNAKGDYVLLTWNFNLRDWRERERVRTQYDEWSEDCPALDAPGDSIRPNQSTWGMDRDVSEFACETRCVGFSPCNPSVICISPNGEGFATGETHSLPQIGGDERYGARVMLSVAQFMADLYYQTPFPSCEAWAELEQTFDFTWQEDDGTCANLDNPEADPPIFYYAQRFYVEARCSIPDGAPELPDRIHIGCLSLEELDVESQPAGYVCAPPEYPGNSFSLGVIDMTTVNTAWGIMLREESCVCAQTRPEMVEVYEQDGARCVT